MERKEFKILAVSHSNGNVGSYILVLSSGEIKIPIVIKQYDAHRLVLQIENIKPERPLIHDLFKTMGESYGIDIQEIYIHSIKEGVFYVNISLHNGIEEVVIDSSIGDAVILSNIYKCPIYISDEVISKVGVRITDDGDIIDDGKPQQPTPPKQQPTSIEKLEIMLNEAVYNEEYEIAAGIRDRIEELKAS